MDSRYETGIDDLAAVRAIAETYGFCLIRDVFRPDELAAILAAMADRKAAAIDDVLDTPTLKGVILDARILRIARALLGDTLVFYNAANVNYEKEIGAYALNPYRDLHPDAMGMPSHLGAIWEGPPDVVYQGYRFAIYFQDYATASGGLKVCPGSHRGNPRAYVGQDFFDPTRGEIIDGLGIAVQQARHEVYNVPARPGDVVVWNLRTFHGGGARLWRGNPSQAFHPVVEDYIASVDPSQFLPPPGPRNAFFFDYAGPTAEADMYIKHLAAKVVFENLALIWPWVIDDPAQRQDFGAAGVRVRTDRLMVPLARWLAASETLPSSLDRRAWIERGGRRLIAMAETHEEYGPHHRWFDPAQLRAHLKNGEAITRQYLAGAITEAVKNSKLKVRAAKGI
jgi:ectoine hydroxylase-related dioxygenase (phytanoyl-CoA dioxygenase family)